LPQYLPLHLTRQRVPFPSDPPHRDVCVRTCFCARDTIAWEMENTPRGDWSPLKGTSMVGSGRGVVPKGGRKGKCSLIESQAFHVCTLFFFKKNKVNFYHLYGIGSVQSVSVVKIHCIFTTDTEQEVFLPCGRMKHLLLATSCGVQCGLYQSKAARALRLVYIARSSRKPEAAWASPMLTWAPNKLRVNRHSQRQS